jgi:hypothetical protein
MGPPNMNAQPFDSHSQNYFARNHHIKRLPSPQELASRIEEARTSAKLLSQLIQSTPPSELLDSDLIKEFADRCQSASRSIQAYMIAENPSPDNDTMETLIETNEHLGKAMNQHQRAVLSARKAAGLGTTPTPPPGRDSAYMPPPRTESGFAPPPGPPPSETNTSKPAPLVTAAPVPRKAMSKQKTPQIPPPGDYGPNLSEDEEESSNPFSDPPTERAGNVKPPYPEDKAPVATGQFEDRLGIEPYHPGFRETHSYVGRQDSSLGKVTMHAAGDVEEEGEDEDYGGRGGYGAQSGAKAPVYRY